MACKKIYLTEIDDTGTHFFTFCNIIKHIKRTIGVSRIFCISSKDRENGSAFFCLQTRNDAKTMMMMTTTTIEFNDNSFSQTLVPYGFFSCRIRAVQRFFKQSTIGPSSVIIHHQVRWFNLHTHKGRRLWIVVLSPIFKLPSAIFKSYEKKGSRNFIFSYSSDLRPPPNKTGNE